MKLLINGTTAHSVANVDRNRPFEGRSPAGLLRDKLRR